MLFNRPNGGNQDKAKEEEVSLDDVKITTEMKEFVRNLCDHPDTFQKFPLEFLDPAKRMGNNKLS
jgi:hypothetical protein